MSTRTAGPGNATGAGVGCGAPSETTPGSYLLRGDITPQVLATMTAWCARIDVLPTDIRIDQRRLEDVFLELTGRELRG